MTWLFQVGSSASYGKESLQVSVSKVRNNRITDTYVCAAVQSLDCTLSAGQNIGVGTVTLGNVDGAIFQDLDAKPHAMDILHIRGRNRHGIWGPMWTGYIDSVHQVDTPQQGRTCVISATSPQKIFQIRLQLPGDVSALALSSIGGLAGSAILKYVCAKTPVRYPGALHDLAAALGYESKLAPHIPTDTELAESNSGIASWENIAAAVFLDPNQQSWESVLEGVIADSGIQWFFDEMGSLLWQQPKYISGARGAKPVILTEDDLFSRDLGETDSGVVTSVTVRYGIVELNAVSVTRDTAGATESAAGSVINPIKDQLGTRVLVIYANWILHKDSATNLANLLLQMYASNVLVGTIITAPDPTITIGGLVQVPTGRRVNTQGDEEQGIYYVAAIEYTLTWGSSYVMVLGLQYGRGVATGWAYPGAQPYPQLTIPKSEQLNTTIASFDNGNPSRMLNTFTIVDRAGLPSNTALVDPTLIPPGTTILLTEYRPATGTPGPYLIIGSSGTGLYTAIAGTKGQGFVIYVSDPGGVTKGNVTLVQGAAADPTFTGDAGGGPSTGQITVGPSQTRDDPGSLKFGPPFGVRWSFTQPFGRTSYTEPPYYWPPPAPGEAPDSNNLVGQFHTGVDLSTVGGNGPGHTVLAVFPGKVIACVPDGTPGGGDLGVYRCNVASGACVDGCEFAGFGNNVVVLSGNYLIHYAHLSSFIVKPGEGVIIGTSIGIEGATGHADGTHVHIGLWDLTAQAWMDPQPFFLAGGVTL